MSLTSIARTSASVAVSFPQDLFTQSQIELVAIEVNVGGNLPASASDS
jgi:hypothetical protein